MRIRTVLVVVSMFVISSVVWAVPVQPISNLDCVGENDPYTCCSDNCDGKGRLETIMILSTYSDVCDLIWDRPCSDKSVETKEESGTVYWLVDIDICTEEQAVGNLRVAELVDVNDDPTTTVNCTEQRVLDKVCKGEFQGEQIPKPDMCYKAVPKYFKYLLKRARNQGRDAHRYRNEEVTDDTDPME